MSRSPARIAASTALETDCDPLTCLSTVAVMLRTIGRREAAFSLMLSVGVALIVSGLVRLMMEAVRYIA